jgi:hypothetical protein
MSTSKRSQKFKKESALRTASQNGDALQMRHLLDEKTNPNCTDSVSSCNFNGTKGKSIPATLNFRNFPICKSYNSLVEFVTIESDYRFVLYYNGVYKLLYPVHSILIFFLIQFSILYS